MDEDNQLKVWGLLWRWWSARNKVNAGEKQLPTQEIISLVTFYVTEFEKLKKKEVEKGTKKKVKWEPPPPEVYNINIDASFRAITRSGGWGFVARDNNGVFLEGGCGHLEHISNPTHAEALAALYSLKRIAHLGMTRIIFETDASNLHKGLTSDELDRSLEGPLFRQIRDFIAHNFVHCMVRTCLRSCNEVADSLAAHGASVVRSGSMVFMDQVPEFVTNLVSGDLPRESSLMQICP